VREPSALPGDREIEGGRTLFWWRVDKWCLEGIVSAVDVEVYQYLRDIRGVGTPRAKPCRIVGHPRDSLALFGLGLRREQVNCGFPRRPGTRNYEPRERCA